MRSTTTRKRPPPKLVDGSVVDGYLVEGTMKPHGERELLYEARGPDGEAVSLVIARIVPVDPHAAARFNRWARVRATLRHPALLPIRAVGTHDGRPYLATERYPEETFADLTGRAPLAPEKVLALLTPVCEAIDRAHARGLVHQDLSSASLLVDDDGLLLDTFGLAGGPAQPIIASADGTQETRHLPPEELEGEALQPASNVYALAFMLEQALGTETAVASPGFEDVIARGTAANPAHRPPSARRLLSEAASALGLAPGSAVVVPAAPQPAVEEPPVAPAARPTRTPRALVIATVVIAAVAGLLAGALVRPFESESSSPPARSADARVLDRLDERRVELRARLSASETPQEQAAAAAELAKAYGQAAQTADSRALVAAAETAEVAYAELAAAGEAGDGGAFWLAEDAVTKAERRLRELAARQ